MALHIQQMACGEHHSLVLLSDGSVRVTVDNLQITPVSQPFALAWNPNYKRVCAVTHRQQWREWQCVTSLWQKALKEAKIDNFRFHDLRHCTASYLAMNGASLPEIAMARRRQGGADSRSNVRCLR